VYKVIWLVRFRRDKSREEVVRWWPEEHGPLAATTPGMVRYVQNYWTHHLDPTTQLEDESAEPHFDGHEEHWFADLESYKLAMASEEWKRTREDGPNGFDSSTLVGGALSEYDGSGGVRSVASKRCGRRTGSPAPRPVAPRPIAQVRCLRQQLRRTTAGWSAIGYARFNSSEGRVVSCLRLFMGTII
jgi:hypothetical protein